MDIEDIIDEVTSANYITRDTSGQVLIHKTLRDIGNIYSISHTTISKAMKNDKICRCKSKTNGVIVIRKLDSI